MKRSLIFPILFPPLALLVYVTPLVITEGIPKLSFIFFLLGSAYSLALVPALVAASADLTFKAKPFRIAVTTVVGAKMAYLVAWLIGDRMYSPEIISVILTGAIPAAVCSWLTSLLGGSRPYPAQTPPGSRLGL